MNLLSGTQATGTNSSNKKLIFLSQNGNIHLSEYLICITRTIIIVCYIGKNEAEWHKLKLNLLV